MSPIQEEWATRNKFKLEMYSRIYRGISEFLKTQTAGSNSHGQNMNDSCTEA